MISLARADGFYAWQELRRTCDLWPYSKSTDTAPKTTCVARDDKGALVEGVNFASQDYLSLSSHPHVKEAAIQAVKQYGVHSAGSAALLGNTKNSLMLEKTISEFTGGREIVPVSDRLVGRLCRCPRLHSPSDHVVMDVLAHSCLQEGARAATGNIHFHGHLNAKGLERRLQKVRQNDMENAILVVTESLFSMHSTRQTSMRSRQFAMNTTPRCSWTARMTSAPSAMMDLGILVCRTRLNAPISSSVHSPKPSLPTAASLPCATAPRRNI